MSMNNPLGFDSALAIDAGTIDRQLQTISHVEATWALPSLPDAVKLDIVGNPNMGDMAMEEFLHGLAADMVQPAPVASALDIPDARDLYAASQVPELAVELTPPPEPFQSQARDRFDKIRTGLLTPAELQEENALANRARGLFADIAQPGQRNDQRPSVIAEGVIEWKREAKARGYLPEDTPEDGSWGPQFNSARYLMGRDQAQAEMAGDRRGAISFTNAMDVMDKWMSPSGLVISAAAVIKDSFDVAGGFKRGVAEMAEFGDKWDAWRDDMTDLGKAWDVVTGTGLDDIALPILNIGLVMSGVGSVGLFATKSSMLAKAGLTLGKFSSATGVNVGYAARSASLARPGIATSLIKATPKGAQFLEGNKLAKGLAAWREYHSIQTAKVATQEMMKLGVVGNLESELFNTGRDDDFYTKWVEKRTSNPIGMALTNLIELPLAPQSIAAEGRVANLWGKGMRSGTRFFGSAVEGLDQSEELQTAIHAPLMRHIAETNPELAAKAQRAKDPTHQIAVVLAKADPEVPLTAAKREELGERMYFVAVAVGLDKDASANISAGLTGLERQGALHTWRNKKIAMLRDIPEIPDDLRQGAAFSKNNREHVAWAESHINAMHGLDYDKTAEEVAARLDLLGEPLDAAEDSFRGSVTAREKARDRVRAALYGDDPVAAKEEVDSILAKYANHSEQRVATWNEILDGINEADFADYLTRNPELIESFDRWAGFENAMHEMESLAVDQLGGFKLAGVDDLGTGIDPRLKAQLDEIGTRIDFFNSVADYGDLYPDLGQALTAIDNWETLPDAELRRLADLGGVGQDLPDAALARYRDNLAYVAKNGGDPADADGWLRERLDEASSGLFDAADAGDGPDILDRILPDHFVKMRKWKPNSLDETLRRAVLSPADLRKSGKILRSYDTSHPLEMAATRVGVARSETITKQQAHALAAYLKSTEKKALYLEGGMGLSEAEMWETYGEVLVAQKGWEKMRGKRLQETIDKAVGVAPGEGVGAHVSDLPGAKISPAKLREYRDHLRAVVTEGGTAGPEASKWFRGRLQEVFDNDRIWQDLKLSRIHDAVDAPELFSKKVLEAADYLAAEIEVPPLVRAKLEAQGYKPVLMQERLSPSDLVGLGNPITDVTMKRLNQKSLGAFFSRPEEGALGKIRRSNLYYELSARLEPLGVFKEELDDVRRILQDAVETGQGGKMNFGGLQAFNAAEEGTTWGQRILARGSAMLGAKSIHDLTPNQVRTALQGYTFDGVPMSNYYKEITAALQASRPSGFEARGLAHLEDSLTSRSMLYRFFEGMGANALADEMRAGRTIRQKMLGIEPLAERGGIEQFAAAKRAAGAAIGAWAGANTAVNEEGNWAAGALVGAATGGVLGGRVVQPRTVAAFMAAKAAGEHAPGEDFDWGAAALGGAAAYAASPYVGRKGLDLLGSAGWGEYSRLGPAYQKFRDALRFSLSPIFDAQRYTEAINLGAARQGEVLKATGKTINPRGLFRPLDFVVDSTDDAFRHISSADEARAIYRQALGQRYGTGSKIAELTDILDELGDVYLKDRGILGFSVIDHEAGLYHQLLATGMSGDDALEMARSTYGYGSKGRSAAEQSVNFVFFPFSFSKKYVSEMGSFMFDDLSRLNAIHMTLLNYETLNERYDLSSVWEERLPILRQMRDFNPLAFGFSPGRFGGANAPLIELAMNSKPSRAGIDPIMNAFIPQALEIASPEQAHDLGDFMHQSLAIARDSKQLIRDLGDQQYAWIDSPEHVTRRAEEQRGWEAWTALREQQKLTVAVSGADWRAVRGASPGDQWYGVKVQLMAEERAIMERYPGFKASYDRAASNAAQQNRELRYITNVPTTEGERLLAGFSQEAKTIVEALGVGEAEPVISDFGLLDPVLHTALRQRAIELARRSPEFARLYREFFADTYGPIDKEV